MQAAFDASTQLISPGVLRLVPAAQATRYRAVSTWENYVNGAYQQSTIAKELSLRVQQQPVGYVFDIQVELTQLATLDDPEPMEEIALRLAALYQRVVVQADLTGQPVALLNHEEICRTWERMAAEMREAAPETDVLTTTMLAFLGRQVQSPARFLHSLQHDYLYQTLLPGYYDQPLNTPAAPARPRLFAQFFDGVSLCFAEQASLLPVANAAPLTLQLHGPLDEQKTDLLALNALIEKELRQGQPLSATQKLPAVLPAPHFRYQATQLLDTATGLPLQAELQVYARAGEIFNKEYNLTLSRI